MTLLKKLFLFSGFLFLSNVSQNMLASQKPKSPMNPERGAAYPEGSYPWLLLNDLPKALLFEKSRQGKALSKLQIEEQELLEKVHHLRSKTEEHVDGTYWTQPEYDLHEAQGELEFNQQTQRGHKTNLDAAVRELEELNTQPKKKKYKAQ
ncbi:MAG: hypothetical protein P4L31_00790 [Candidatus Babeliales bacterium]|nr:hypothetical protein [Candidatus Babeliales bacterium]